MPLSAIILAVYALMSLVTFIEYGLDKRAARLSRWRIPERRLHVLALMFGWPGALIAQRVFRHKTIDRRFRIIFWLIVAFHIAAWTAFLIWRFRSS